MTPSMRLVVYLESMPLWQAVSLSTVVMGIGAGFCSGGMMMCFGTLPTTVVPTWKEATVAYLKFQNADPISKVKAPPTN
ncbi:hypothetical protein M885DRAFT_517154 [Pelagophyceae sp. CCMP2097]|nr:hypothetical protein M885DRAFT_517154 [Pelagophyceae sp. CCMP2097]